MADRGSESYCVEANRGDGFFLGDSELLITKRGAFNILSTSLSIAKVVYAAHCGLRLDTYVQAMTDEKCKAQSKIVKILLPGTRRGSDLVNGLFWTRGEMVSFVTIENEPALPGLT